MEGKRIKSFQELAVNVRKQQEDADQGVAREFSRILAGKFDKVPRGKFPAVLPGIESVLFIPAPKNGQRPEAFINAEIFYKNKENKERRFTWTINEGDMRYGRIPRDLDVKPHDLAKEILHIIERINLDFWRKTESDIIPLRDEGVGGGSGGGGGGEGAPATDPERLAFMEKQSDALFGFINDRRGFDGYRGVVFPNFIALENETVGNAAYFIELPERIKIPEERFKLGPGKRMNEIESGGAIKEFWEPISEKAKTRKELLALGAKRIIHSPGTWREKMQTEIDLLSAKQK